MTNEAYKDTIEPILCILVAVGLFIVPQFLATIGMFWFISKLCARD